MSQPQTPVSAELALQQFSDALDEARLSLAKARNAEVDAKHAFEKAKRRATLSEACPKVRRGRDGEASVTVAERDAWVEEKVSGERLVYDLATAARQAAADHLRTLRDQGSIQQSISRSVIGSYEAQR